MMRYLALLLALSTGCVSIDFSTARWEVRNPNATRRYGVTRHLAVAPSSQHSELDEISSGCNEFLRKQRDLAIADVERARSRQKLVALIGAVVEVVVGSTALILSRYNKTEPAELVGGVGSVITGALTGTTVGFLTQPNLEYSKRRDAIIKAWDALVQFSAASSQPNPGALLLLKQKVIDACMGVTP